MSKVENMSLNTQHFTNVCHRNQESQFERSVFASIKRAGNSYSCKSAIIHLYIYFYKLD